MGALIQEYEFLLHRFSERLQLEGVRVEGPFRGDAPLVFEALSLSDREAALARTKSELAQHETITPDKDAKDKLFEFCEYNGLQPVDEDIYSRLTNDLCWEVVDFNLSQIYRNSRIYDMVSYSIEEMVAYTPWQLFSRPVEILKELMAITHRLKTSDRLVSMVDMPKYTIEETKSQAHLRFDISHRFCCLLVSQKSRRPVAFVAAFEAKPALSLSTTTDSRVASLHSVQSV